MERKVDALLLRATDYGENDKIVTLLTADLGKIGASMKGVRKAGAKLKFAAQPFCFAEYVLAERAGRSVVTGASLYDGFYPLREDLDSFFAAACVSEACDKLVYEGMAEPQMLLCAVNALKEMCGGDPAFALVKFLERALALAGYPLRLGDCPVCGRKISGRIAFGMQSGSFLHAECGEGVPASGVTYRTLCAAQTGEGAAEADGTRRALRLLGAYFATKTEGELSSLRELLSLS